MRMERLLLFDINLNLFANILLTTILKRYIVL